MFQATTTSPSSLYKFVLLSIVSFKMMAAATFPVVVDESMLYSSTPCDIPSNHLSHPETAILDLGHRSRKLIFKDDYEKTFLKRIYNYGLLVDSVKNPTGHVTPPEQLPLAFNKTDYYNIERGHNCCKGPSPIIFFGKTEFKLYYETRIYVGVNGSPICSMAIVGQYLDCPTSYTFDKKSGSCTNKPSSETITYTVCPPVLYDLDKFSNRCYSHASSEPMTYSQAKQWCWWLSGRLPISENLADIGYFAYRAKPTPEGVTTGYWLGAVRKGDKFEWGNGKPMTYTYYLPNQPDNWDTNEDHLVAQTSTITERGRWNDVASSRLFYTTCQYAP